MTLITVRHNDVIIPDGNASVADSGTREPGVSGGNFPQTWKLWERPPPQLWTVDVVHFYFYSFLHVNLGPSKNSGPNPGSFWFWLGVTLNHGRRLPPSKVQSSSRTPEQICFSKKLSQMVSGQTDVNVSTISTPCKYGICMQTTTVCLT